MATPRIYRMQASFLHMEASGVSQWLLRWAMPRIWCDVPSWLAISCDAVWCDRVGCDVTRNVM